MKRLSLLVVLFVLVVLTVTTVQAQAVGGRYVINFRHSIPADAAARIVAAGGQLVRSLPEVGIVIAVSSNPDFAATMGRYGDVASAGPVPAVALPEGEDVTEPELSAPTATDDLYNVGLVWGVNRVNADQAWAAGITGSHSTVVAVIDTGIAWNHPDLAPNVVFAACFTSQPTCNPYPSLSDHGTHVAGTIAAAFGGGRVVGVGPNLALASYNTFESIPGCGTCSYSDSRWAAYIDIANRGFDVVNMSLGSLAFFGGRGTNELAAFRQAENKLADYMSKRGVLLVASAGNSAIDLNGPAINFPGGITGIINVSATGIRPAPRFPQPGAYDVKAFFSNYGASIGLAAPGGDCGLADSCDPATRPANWFEYLVLSSTVTFTPPGCAATASCTTGYGWKGGTSMAAPHVSGAAGLVRDENPGLSPNQVTAVLKQTAEKIGNSQYFGAGMLDALAAATQR